MRGKFDAFALHTTIIVCIHVGIGLSVVVINVTSKIGIVAKDINSSCMRIQVNLDGCTAFVNGIQVTTSYLQGIGVRKIGDRVRGFLWQPQADLMDCVRTNARCEYDSFRNLSRTEPQPYFTWHHWYVGLLWICKIS